MFLTTIHHKRHSLLLTCTNTVQIQARLFITVILASIFFHLVIYLVLHIKLLLYQMSSKV